MDRKLIIYGMGNMGTAIALGIVKQNSTTKLCLVDPSKSRRTYLKERYGLKVESAYNKIESGDVIILAIPPQDFSDFSENNEIVFKSAELIISVMAGITIDSIRSALKVKKVVRCIPNTPSEVFQGMTVYVTSENLDDGENTLVEGILQSFGKAIKATSEEHIDPATALCGGGPAFVAYIAAAMHKFSTSHGFSPQQSDAMVSQILLGTGELLRLSGKPASQIYKEVMTPNGTTERGIQYF